MLLLRMEPTAWAYVCPDQELNPRPSGALSSPSNLVSQRPIISLLVFIAARYYSFFILLLLLLHLSPVPSPEL